MLVLKSGFMKKGAFYDSAKQGDLYAVPFPHPSPSYRVRWIVLYLRLLGQFQTTFSFFFFFFAKKLWARKNVNETKTN